MARPKRLDVTINSVYLVDMVDMCARTQDVYRRILQNGVTEYEDLEVVNVTRAGLDCLLRLASGETVPGVGQVNGNLGKQWRKACH